MRPEPPRDHRRARVHLLPKRPSPSSGWGDEEADALGRELYDGAVAITETVLYIKQHSVNCIPAALYAMTRITPAEVTPIEVTRFIESLFAGDSAVTRENAERIREHISFLYEGAFPRGLPRR